MIEEAKKLLAAVRKMATLRAGSYGWEPREWRGHLEPIIMEPYDALNEAIERGPWTPISEKPPEGEYVFLYGLFGKDILDGMAPTWARIVIGVWENEGDWFYIPAHQCDVPQKVTHWAPLLPEPVLA